MVIVFVQPDVYDCLLGREKKNLDLLKEKLGVEILIRKDPALHIEEYEVFGKG